MNIATAYIVNKQLEESIVGKTICKVTANQNPHTFVWFATEPARAFTDDRAAGDVAEYLTNKKVERVNVNTGGYGLYIFLHIGKRTLMSDIVPRYTNPKEKPVKKHQNLLQDILWEARINPKKKMDTLNKNEINRIFKAIKKVPSAIIAGGGKDIDKDVYGNISGYKSRVSRNTVGKPCARCGTIIVKEAYLGGSVFYCPACQKI